MEDNLLPNHLPGIGATTMVTEAARLLRSARSLAVLTGAGVSAESGVPTFRDAQSGHWARFDPETLASPRGFDADPGLVWRWYMERLRGVEQARPNPGHAALAALESRFGEQFLLITQNVDDLHERAGTRRIVHLHGNIARFHCRACGEPHELSPADRAAALPPRCAVCSAFVRPGVVWFGEMLPVEALQRAETWVRAADLTLVVGTSGLVYPAADLPFVALRAARSVIDINPDRGPVSAAATLHLPGPSGVLLPLLVEQLDLSA